MPNTLRFTKERLILCEGSSDKAFFCELIKKRELPDIQVYFPSGANDRTGGVSMYERSLRGNRTASDSNFSVVKSILVVADNDNEPSLSFEAVRTQLSNAGYGVPDKELQFVKSPKDNPMVAIMMLPLNQQIGNLETVCKPAIFDKFNSLVPALKAYCDASDAKNWSEGSKAKMQIQCLLAATVKERPYCTISGLFAENEKYHFSVEHPCFDEIVQFLTNWDSMLPK